MRKFAMFSQAFSVIGQHQHSGTSAGRLSSHCFKKTSDLLDRCKPPHRHKAARHTDYQTALEDRTAHVDRRHVPRGKMALYLTGVPATRSARSTTSPALKLGFSRVDFPGIGFRHSIIIDIEALIQPEHSLQHRSADKGRGLPALLFENLSQRRWEGSSTKPPVPRTPWTCGYFPVNMLACEGGVERSLGYSVLEENAFGRELIEMGGRDLPVSVAAQPVSPQGVDRQDNNIEVFPDPSRLHPAWVWEGSTWELWQAHMNTRNRTTKQDFIPVSDICNHSRLWISSIASSSSLGFKNVPFLDCDLRILERNTRRSHQKKTLAGIRQGRENRSTKHYQFNRNESWMIRGWLSC